MRFFRILPAVWATISCPFSSFTRNVALGRSSLTVPGNSRSSSFAIRPQVGSRRRENAPNLRKSKATLSACGVAPRQPELAHGDAEKQHLNRQSLDLVRGDPAGEWIARERARKPLIVLFAVPVSWSAPRLRVSA